MAKKDFTASNPALELLGVSAPQTTDAPTEKPATKKAPAAKKPAKTKKPATSAVPAGFKLAPESKTKRLNLLIQPSLFESAQKQAAKEGVSVNELIHIALREYLS